MDIDRMICNLTRNANCTLEEFNDTYVQILIPALVLAFVVMTLGIMGNPLVIYIYGFKRKKSNHRYFILTLAFLDCLSCFLGMPLLIFHMFKVVVYTNTGLCKLMVYQNYFTSLGNICVIPVIAFDRYRKVCKPLARQMSTSVAKKTLIAIVVVALCCAAPSLLLYGTSSRNVPLPSYNLTLYVCFRAKGYEDTVWQTIYAAFLLLLYIVAVVTVIVWYTFVGKSLWERDRKYQLERSKSEISRSMEHLELSMKSSPMQKKKEVQKTPSRMVSVKEDSSVASEDRDKAILSMKNSVASVTSLPNISMKKGGQPRRITAMLFAVTVVFIASYIPYLTVTILNDELDSLNKAELEIYHVAVRSFLISNMANPIIYLFFDKRFYKDVKGIFCPSKK